MPIPRRTISRTVEIVGTGLFTGRPAILRIGRAEAGQGLRFRRADLREPIEIPAIITSLAVQPPGVPARNTSLGTHPAGIVTVEHVLSALAALDITDALLQMDAPEVPIGDGSAKLFIEAIQRAGVEELPGSIEPLTLDREIVVESGSAHIVASPREAPGCRYTYHLDFGDGPIPPQTATFETDHSPEAAANYAREIAPARTFCMQAEAEAMRAMGLFTNLTPRDMLVFGESGPIDNQLRFDNEPARHKLLDLIGDLALVGRPVQADIVAMRAGHALNHAMARDLVSAAHTGSD